MRMTRHTYHATLFALALALAWLGGWLLAQVR